MGGRGDFLEEFQLSKEMNIFGQTIPVKNFYCSRNGCPYVEKRNPIRLKLSICLTNYCNGNCPYCSVGGSAPEKEFVDPDKLRPVLLELKERDAVIGISITGGEPFTDTVLLNEVVELIFEIFGIEMEISINTNGTGLAELDRIKRYPLVDTIHISRHHYDDERNRNYFNIKVPTEEELAEIVGSVKDKRLFVFNCLLFKDGIGTKEEMKRFLEFSDRVGIPKVAFITPMSVNGYTEENRVSYTRLFDREDPEFLFTNGFRDMESCHCQDGVYVTGNGRLVEFYGRETGYGSPDYVRGFVYTADNRLKTGYGKTERIIV